MKKIFCVLALFLFLGVKQVQADVLLVPTPVDPIKTAINCVYYKDFNKNSNLFLVDTKKKVLVTDNLCIKDESYYIKLFDKRIISPDLVFKNLSENPYSDFLSLPINSKSSNRFGLSGLETVVKKDAPVKTIDMLVIFDSATSSIDLGLEAFNNISVAVRSLAKNNYTSTNSYVDLAKAIDYVKNGVDDVGREINQAEIRSYNDFQINLHNKYVVTWASGEVTELDELGFQQLLKDYAPKYDSNENYNGFNGHKADHWYELLVNMWTDIVLEFSFWLFLLVTILVEGLIFWFFGARRLISYVYLIIVNFISFTLGMSLMAIWPYLSLPGGSIFSFLTAEILVVIIEFLLLNLFLRKRYPVKQILLFSVVANFVTALLGVVIYIFY